MAEIKSDVLYDLYYNKELSLDGISKKLNISVWKVLDLMDRYKIERRGSHSRPKVVGIKKEQIVNTYNNSRTIKEAADKINIPKNTFRTYMRKFNITVKTQKDRALMCALISKEKLERLYVQEKMSAITIAKKYNVHYLKIYPLMKLYNIKKRTNAEALKLAYKNNVRVSDNGGNTQRNKNFFISKDELVYLYSKLTIVQIAKKLDTSAVLIRRWLEKYNIQVHKRNGKNNSNWKGGVMYDQGRKLIYYPSHPNPDFLQRYVYEYRLIMEKYIGRFLTKDEVIHHKDEDVTNNKIENLQLCKNQSEHVKIHRR